MLFRADVLEVVVKKLVKEFPEIFDPLNDSHSERWVKDEVTD